MISGINIIEEYIDRINKRVKKVIIPEIEPDWNNEKSAGQSSKIYNHVMFRTRGYRDKDCAVFKALKFLEELSNKPIDEIYWRCLPEITEHYGFWSQIKKYAVTMRYSYY